MKHWKAFLAGVAVTFFVGMTSSHAITGLGFGIHGGMGNYRGDVFRFNIGDETFESGNVGSAIQYGGHVKVGTLPIVDLYLKLYERTLGNI